jgi:type III secretory pathway lipoprotein EscJ
MASDFSKVYETGNPLDAELTLQLLQENGIEATLLNKRDSSYQAFGVIEIYCHTNQVIQALHLINNNPTHEE